MILQKVAFHRQQKHQRRATLATHAFWRKSDFIAAHRHSADELLAALRADLNR